MTHTNQVRGPKPLKIGIPDAPALGDDYCGLLECFAAHRVMHSIGRREFSFIPWSGGGLAKSKKTESLASEKVGGSTGLETILKVVGTISQGFFILDSEWRFAYLNNQAAQQFGSVAEKLTG